MRKYQLKAWEKLCNQDSRKIYWAVPFVCSDKARNYKIATTGASVLVWTREDDFSFGERRELYSQYEYHWELIHKNINIGHRVEINAPIIDEIKKADKEGDTTFQVPGTNTYVNLKKLKYLYEFCGKTLVLYVSEKALDPVAFRGADMFGLLMPLRVNKN